MNKAFLIAMPLIAILLGTTVTLQAQASIFGKFGLFSRRTGIAIPRI